MQSEKNGLKLVLLLHSPFLLDFFLGGKRKRVRNNQLSYKTEYNRNSPNVEFCQDTTTCHNLYERSTKRDNCFYILIGKKTKITNSSI